MISGLGVTYFAQVIARVGARISDDGTSRLALGPRGGRDGGGRVEEKGETQEQTDIDI